MRKGLTRILTVIACCGLVSACGSSSKKSSAPPTASGTTTSSGSSGAATSAAAAAKFPPIPAGPIKFGISAPLSGAIAEAGLQEQKAFTQVTLKQFNQLHPDGIDGHPVQLDIRDDASDVTTAVNVANQFVADKVAAVITVTVNPAATPQQTAIFNKAKVPMISDYPYGTDYTNTAKWPYFFGTGASVPQEGQASAQWIAKHPEIQKIAVLTDNSPPQEDNLNSILEPLKTAAPNAQVVKTVSITPGAVDVTTAIAQLKAANPDLLLVTVGFGYGPIWQAMHAASWSPKILAPPVWYDAFDAMGSLANNGAAFYYECVTPDHPPFSKQMTDLMDGYVNTFGSNIINALTYVGSDLVPMEMAKLAIEKYHSVDPDAIKQAMEGMQNQTFFDTLTYNFSASNHFGLSGALGASACKLAPFSDGPYRIPFVAP
jgi:ABC-type branched-subunit amino acid transport system substrate-binding protein